MKSLRPSSIFTANNSVPLIIYFYCRWYVFSYTKNDRKAKQR